MSRKPKSNGLTVLLTGSQGFIGGYLAKQLLEKGYRVIGVDNYSKYGIVRRAHDDHPMSLFARGEVAYRSVKTIVDYADQLGDLVVIMGTESTVMKPCSSNCRILSPVNMTWSFVMP